MADRDRDRDPDPDHRLPLPSPTIPPAPPPPPPPPPREKTRSYFERFVAQPLTSAYISRPPSVQAHRTNSGLPNVLVPKLPDIRPGHILDASHRTGLDISAIDINRERTHAVLAGKEILKTVRVQEAKIVDDANLRAAVLSSSDSYARQREGLSIHDVKWSHGQFSSHIATAVANGKVILYDLNRASVELTRLHEHTRQVHKLAFNPHQGHLLLSASHDASVRLWDLRDMRRDAATCRSRDHYSGMNGGIRDVQWSPTDAVEFAFGTDNGTIQRWDFRHSKRPKQTITAHDQRICTSIDWHPDGKHMLSSGVDRTVKVWDFSTAGRRQKPLWVLHTPYPVHRARWRPPYWSDEHHEKGAYQCTQLATSYDREHAIIHVWDLRRPFLPFREINRCATSPSDMLWHSRDTLWTVGKEGLFQQSDVRHAPKTVDRRNLQAFAISPTGLVAGVAQKRPRRPPSTSLTYSANSYSDVTRDSQNSPEKDSFRSSADDSLDDSFLMSSMRQQHGHLVKTRSAKILSSAPPSDAAPKVVFLTDSTKSHSEYLKPNQIAFRGVLPGSYNVLVFAYLAQKYKAISLSDPFRVAALPDSNRVFEQNAEYAQRAAFYRLAQTWRIVGASIAVSMRRRAELLKRRLEQQSKTTLAMPPDSVVKGQLESCTTKDKRLSVPPNPAVRAILGALDKTGYFTGANPEVSVVESTSNLTTPLARPISTSDLTLTEGQKLSLPELDGEEFAQLPPSVSKPKDNFGELGNGGKVESNGTKVETSLQPNLTGSRWYHSQSGFDERRAMVGSWRAPPRTPLSFQQHSDKLSITVPPPLLRKDSGESFTMFSASTESHQSNSITGSFASAESQSHSTNSLEGGVMLEKSSFGNTTRLPPTANRLDKTAFKKLMFNADKHELDPSSDEVLIESSSGERAMQEMEHLRRNNQLMRHDSSESERYPSSRDSPPSPPFDSNVDMEASGTIVPDTSDEVTSPLAKEPSTLPSNAPEIAPAVLTITSDDANMLAGLQALDGNPEEGSPYSMIDLLNNLLSYHTVASDAQFASTLLLLLTPLLPQTHVSATTSAIEVSEVLGVFADTFTLLGLSAAQAKTILSTQLSQLIATGINPYQAESILYTYHSQLHSLALFNSAAYLRRLAYPAYPAVYEQALKDTQLGLLCLGCNSPINNPRDKMKCETCKQAQAPCPICWGRLPAFEPVTSKKNKASGKFRVKVGDLGHRRGRTSMKSSQIIDFAVTKDQPSPMTPLKWTPSRAVLWTWCPLCGHGGHTNCLSAWFTDPLVSEGSCATEGCLCDCVQGKRRDEKIQEALRRKTEKERWRDVRKGDDWKVSESRAVSAVRTAALDTNLANPPIPSYKEDSKSARVIAP